MFIPSIFLFIIFDSSLKTIALGDQIAIILNLLSSSFHDKPRPDLSFLVAIRDSLRPLYELYFTDSKDVHFPTPLNH